MTDDYIDTREGWREVDENDYVAQVGRERMFTEHRGKGRFFVRKDPVPPLPTVLGTVVLAEWRDGIKTVMILKADGWYRVGGSTYPRDMTKIVGYEMVSDPTAIMKAVADRIVIRLKQQGMGDWRFDSVLREFGVQV